ncbi:hypothetical protein FRC15_007820, partial [Serendipita sp. 397]
FLQPDKSALTDTFESAFYRPTVSANEHYGWDTSLTGAQYGAKPAPPAPTSNANPPPSAPGRNRRNTLNAPAAPPPAPQATSKPTITSANRNAQGLMDTIHTDPDSFGDFLFNPGANARPPPPYAGPNKSTATLSNATNKYATWTSPNIYDDPLMELQQSPDVSQAEVGLWASEDAIRAMSKPPPMKPGSARPVESKPAEYRPVESKPAEKEAVPEKKTKGIKSLASVISKKAAPPEPVPSISLAPAATIRSGITPTRPSLANLANRKSTIAVEDATPYNTPPKTTVRLPSPPPASPPAVKTKKAKSKKGSISDAAKDLERLEKERQEKERLEAEQRELERLEDERRELERLEREREEQERMEQERQEQERLAQEKAEQEEIERYMRQSDDFYGTEDNEFSMPGGFGSFSQPKSRLRSGSSPSATDRATSPFSMFGAARAGAGTKKEPTPKAKPAAAKPSFSKPSGFAWGTKPKMSPPIDNDLATDGFSFSTSLFSSSGWKTKNEETALVPHSTLSPQSEKPSSTTSSPVTTPPVKKSGWKTKSTSYFPETKPTASSPKYEEDDLAHLKAQMEATPKA